MRYFKNDFDDNFVSQEDIEHYYTVASVIVKAIN